MDTDDLDTRIRGLVADAVAGTPAAPDLPTSMPAAAPSPRRGWVWAGIGVAAAAALVGALVWTGKDAPDGIVPATSDSGSTTAEPVIAWPEGVSVLVASERGIEQVSSEDGSAVVTRLFDDTPVSRAIMLEDGSIVYQRTGGDIEVLTPALQPAGEPLVTDDGSGATTLEDADAPNGSLRLVYRTPSTDPASSFQLGAWFQPNEPLYTSPPGSWAVGYRRFSIVDQTSVIAATIDDTGQRSTFGFGFGDGEQTAPGFEAPYLVVGNGAGSYAVLRADGKVEMTGVISGVVADLGDPTLVADIDVRGEWLVAQFTDGSATLVHTADGTEYDMPVANGVVMLSRYALPTTLPTPTTVPTTAPPTTTLPVAGEPAMVTTGLNGVWELGPDGPVQWSTEPMAVAVKAPDGSMIVQRKAGNGEGDNWTIADTLPLRIASPGAEPEDLFEQLMPAADVVPGWYTVHDSATVFGRSLLLLDRQAAQSQGIETPNGALLVLDLEAGSLEQIGSVGGWEEGISRLHLAENGLIVGEWYSGVSRGLFLITVGGDVPLDHTDLGLESQYDDCGDCPRLYAVSRDGSTIAWLDGTTLVRFSLVDSTALPVVDLGGFALDATDLSVAGNVAVFDRRYRDLTPPVLVTIDPNAATSAEQVTSEELGAATRAVLI